VWREGDHLAAHVGQRVEDLIAGDGVGRRSPAVTIAPAMSSRKPAADAIMARALSFTDDGAWPSAQLIAESALELEAAVRDSKIVLKCHLDFLQALKKSPGFPRLRAPL
jgi:hypothetical protein